MLTPSEIQTCIDNLTSSSQPIDFTLLAAETSNANTGISFSVPTVNDLPDLETTDIGEGQIIFVESLGVPVVSAFNLWQGLDGRILRKDFSERLIFSWGCNTCGVLSDGTTLDRCSPVRESSLPPLWSRVAAGNLHSVAVKTNGELWSWGCNVTGKLGIGTSTNFGAFNSSPVREICSATDWCFISAGWDNTLAIKTSGQLWSWGRNDSGQLGIGITCTFGQGACSPVQERCSDTSWCQASIGNGHALGVKTSGQLWSWGCNCFGQLGQGTTTNRNCPLRERCSDINWCQASAGNLSSAAIKTSGELWTWGNNCGQFSVGGNLADGTTINRCSPVREITSSINWCQVSIGGTQVSSTAIKTDGSLWVWGQNGFGQLGDGTTVNTCSPVREICSATDWCQTSRGQLSTTAIKTSGQLWSWGYNSCGRLGDGTVTSRCSPVRERCSATDWCQVTTGLGHVIAIRVI